MADVDPKSLNFMKLKKWMVEKGVEKAELDKCSGKEAIIRLAESKGLIESDEPAPEVVAPAPAEAAPVEPALEAMTISAPAPAADDPFAQYEGTMQEKELAYLCDWIKNNGRICDGGFETTFGELFDGVADLLDGLVGNIRKGKKVKKLKSNAEVFFKGQSDAEVIILVQ